VSSMNSGSIPCYAYFEYYYSHPEGLNPSLLIDPPSLLIDSSVGWSLVFVFGLRLNFLASMSSDRRGILLSPDVSLQGKRTWMMFAFYSFQPFHFQCLVTVVILLSSRCLFCFQLLSTFSLSCIGASGEPNSHMHNFHIHNTSFSVH
jgi:hypothetical protein